MDTPQIVGILNLTPDSFSDGGLYINPPAALQKARQLSADGADLIDLGAESSRPGARRISAHEEVRRLHPVIRALKSDGLRLSVDSYKPEVMQAAIDLGVDMINDITALKDPRSVAVVKAAGVPVVIMYSRAPGPQADRTVRDYRNLVPEILGFFEERIAALTRQGIRPDTLIIDPGMGFFLGANPEPSLTVLKHLHEFKRLGTRVYLSTSRKSFIGSVLRRGLAERAAGTLATEIWACLQGVDFLRTHEVKPLRDAIRMIQAIENVEGSGPRPRSA